MGKNLVAIEIFTYNNLLRRTAATSPFFGPGNRQRLDLQRSGTNGNRIDHLQRTNLPSNRITISISAIQRGRLVEITNPSGRKAAYSFDVRNQLEEIDWDGSQIEDV